MGVAIDGAQQRNCQRTHTSTCTRTSALKHVQGLESMTLTYDSDGHVRSMNIPVTFTSNLPQPQLAEAGKEFHPHCSLQASAEGGAGI